jgi:hypothetical protein
MRMMMLGMVGVVVMGGYAMSGGRADVERVVHRPPHQVYQAFSDSFGSEGTVVQQEVHESDGLNGTLTATVTKKTDKMVELDATIDNTQMFKLAVRFAPADDGTTTKLSADVAMDGRLMARGGPTPPQLLVDRATKMAAEYAIDNAIKDIEAGRPIKPIGLNGMRSMSADSAYRGAGEMVAQPHLQQPGESRIVPRQSTAPMVDPNAAARHYMNKSSW